MLTTDEFSDTISTAGLVPLAVPLVGITVSQLPPLVVEGVAVNEAVSPLVDTVSGCAGGNVPA